MGEILKKVVADKTVQLKPEIKDPKVMQQVEAELGKLAEAQVRLREFGGSGAVAAEHLKAVSEAAKDGPEAWSASRAADGLKPELQTQGQVLREFVKAGADLTAIARAMPSAVATEDAVGRNGHALGSAATFEITFSPLVKGLEIHSEGAEVRVKVEEFGFGVRVKANW